MAYRFCILGTLVRISPTVAVRRIVVAFRHEGGNTTQAAARLNVDRRTLMRWVVLLDEAGYEIRAAIDDIRAEAA